MEHNNLILAVRLASYLTFYPFLLVIPIQLISLKNKVGVIDWIKGNYSNKKSSLIKESLGGIVICICSNFRFVLFKSRIYSLKKSNDKLNLSPLF